MGQIEIILMTLGQQKTQNICKQVILPTEGLCWQQSLQENIC